MAPCFSGNWKASTVSSSIERSDVVIKLIAALLLLPAIFRKLRQFVSDVDT